MEFSKHNWVADILVLAPYGLSKLLEVCFEFPFNLIGFFNRPIMTRTQILVHRWGPKEQGFWRCLTDGLYQSLVSCVAQTSCTVDC